MTKNNVTQNDENGKTLVDVLSEMDASEIVRLLGEAFINVLMSEEADSICKVPYGIKDPDNRVNSRNGYRMRSLDTTAGTIELAIPKLREGSYYPKWLIEQSKRSDHALWAAVAEIYVNGTSTRKVDKVVKALGIEGVSSSQVSRMCSVLDDEVDSFRTRTLEGPFPILWVDATSIRCRQTGRVASAMLFVATTVDSEGKRVLAGISLYPSETYEAWREFLEDIRSRGVSGVVCTVSDAHEGLKRSLSEIYPEATWQRCRTHLTRDVQVHIPLAKREEVSTSIHRVFKKEDPLEAKDAYHKTIDLVSTISERAARILEEAEDDALAYLAFPKETWRKIQSNNSQERLNRDIKRRTRVVGAFPSEASVIRLVGSLLAEIDSDWQARSYISKDKIRAILERAESETVSGRKRPPSVSDSIEVVAA